MEASPEEGVAATWLRERSVSESFRIGGFVWSRETPVFSLPRDPLPPSPQVRYDWALTWRLHKKCPITVPEKVRLDPYRVSISSHRASWVRSMEEVGVPPSSHRVGSPWMGRTKPTTQEDHVTPGIDHVARYERFWCLEFLVESGFHINNSSSAELQLLPRHLQ